MRLSTLLELPRNAGAPDPDIEALTVSSRDVRPGLAFVALAGARHHGLEFLEDALARGAVAVLWEPAPGVDHERLLDGTSSVPCIPIDGLSTRLGELASRLHGAPSESLRVIGVTGTNGKSSFVHLLGGAVARREPAGTIGTLGAGRVGAETPLLHTTPDAASVQRLLAELRDDGARTVAMEVSSHALDQGRVNSVAFRGAVVTNVTRDHLDYHGTMAAYTAAKARLMTFESLEFAILNADDGRVDAFRRPLAAHVRRIEYGIGAGDVRASDLQFDAKGTRCTLTLDGAEVSVRFPLLGRFNVYNALAVAATLHALGWAPDAIADALAASTPVPGRMNAITRPGQPMVVVDYAHTPDALAQCLAALREHTGGRRLICVFGCGGDRDRGKRSEMGAIAEQHADVIIVTDDNPRTEDGDRIVADILAGLSEPSAARVVRDRAAAIAEAVARGRSGDVVLVAGKGHETYQESQGQRLPFDDRRAAAAALEAAS